MVHRQGLAKMAPKDFFALHYLAVEFVAKSEQYNDRQIAGLRGTLATLSRSFVQAFHADKITVLSMLLENEQWEVAMVPREFQAIVDDLMQPTAATAATAMLRAANVSTNAGASAAGTPSAVHSAVLSSEAVAAESLLLGETRCYVVSSVLMAVRFLMEYTTIAVNVPSCALEVLQRTVEFLHVWPSALVVRARRARPVYLLTQGLQYVCRLFSPSSLQLPLPAVGGLSMWQLFNSRTCQVILGAGAIATAGLKSITSKHLGSRAFGMRGPREARVAH